ncbi:transposase domain-containing protein [Massilia jejuensis]|uniref:transposase domain-containing protein n=1 Tax=Massilia jejuensis TaxID=648894 RepID=UPI003A8FEF85
MKHIAEITISPWSASSTGPAASSAQQAAPSCCRCAKLTGLDPARWLADTLDRLPTCPNSKIDSLLPFADSTQG